MALFGVLGFGGVKSCSAESRQVFVVRARSATHWGTHRKGVVHGLQCIHHPWRHRSVFDVVPEVPQTIFAKVEIIDEGRIIDHDFGFFVEVIVLHEFVIEVKRNSKSIRYRAFRKTKRTHGCDIGAFCTKSGGHLKADVIQRQDFGDAQIAHRNLRFRRAECLVPFVDLIQTRFSDVVRFCLNPVIDVIAQKACDRINCEWIGDVSVGDVVLNGPQIHVRKGSLDHRGHDAANARQ